MKKAKVLSLLLGWMVATQLDTAALFAVWVIGVVVGVVLGRVAHFF